MKPSNDGKTWIESNLSLITSHPTQTIQQQQQQIEKNVFLLLKRRLFELPSKSHTIETLRVTIVH